MNTSLSTKLNFHSSLLPHSPICPRHPALFHFHITHHLVTHTHTHLCRLISVHISCHVFRQHHKCISHIHAKTSSFTSHIGSPQNHIHLHRGSRTLTHTHNVSQISFIFYAEGEQEGLTGEERRYTGSTLVITTMSPPPFHFLSLADASEPGRAQSRPTTSLFSFCLLSHRRI